MMNSLWNPRCLDGEWALYIAENRLIKGQTFTTESELTGDAFTKIAGRVPGNFELDMERAGLIPDLFFGTNTLKAQELENRHLWYVRTFRWEGGCADRTYFNFEGIDTVAEIYLNGNRIAETDNMLIAHEVKATGLRVGENELMVHIRPVVLEARNRELEPFVTSALPYNYESLTMRKAAHMYGWDIVPRIVSGGIWRSVYLFEKPMDYVEDVYLYTTQLLENRADINVYYKVNAESSDFNRDYTIKVTGVCGESRFEAIRRLWHVEGTLSIAVENPCLWWSRDMGDPNLYAVTVELLLNDKVVDTYQTRMGIRTVVLENTELTDENGSGEFRFVINGEPVFIRGTNWVPVDSFHSRDKERMPMATNLLWESGCNAIRCWGGNVYEDHDLFDFCDEHGILVWQDFGMGCATYPITEAVRDALKTEAVAVVKKLRQHASLALWAGDNECDECMAQWGVFKRNPVINKLTREVLPEVVCRQDPVRQFLPSSPYIGETAYGHYDWLPERHLWGPRDYFKSEFYTKNYPHFASETGYHGCPSPASLKNFLSEDKLWPWKDNDEWIVHATEMILPEELGGSGKPYDRFPYLFRVQLMANQVETLFGVQPDTLEDFALASQISEAEADKFFVERFRATKWRRTGIMWWNLLDGWPQFSDAVVDYYGVRKLAFFVLQNVQQPVCLIFREPEDGKHTLVLANETREEKCISYTVRELVTGKTVLTGEAKVGANAIAEIATVPSAGDEVRFYAMEWEVDGNVCRNYYLTGKPPYDLKQVTAWLKEAGVLKLEGF